MDTDSPVINQKNLIIILDDEEEIATKVKLEDKNESRVKNLSL